MDSQHSCSQLLISTNKWQVTARYASMLMYVHICAVRLTLVSNSAFAFSSTYLFSTMVLTVFLLGMVYVGSSFATNALNPGSSNTVKGWESFTMKSTRASSSSCFLDPTINKENFNLT
ncbi:hypothetical protein XENOCAPTIV_010135 [Xenoophorus captivus]|uniref:Uncharacterized protein n=1 Tax=Xenoophorus captivus TaxID=1517983 RepID=A0ABV0QHJ7_9TELE